MQPGGGSLLKSAAFFLRDMFKDSGGSFVGHKAASCSNSVLSNRTQMGLQHTES